MKLFWIIISVFLSAHLFGEESSALKELRFDPVDQKRSRTVPVKVYLTPSEQPKPVILYSHGLGGSREAKNYLGTHWAKHGYIAVFMQHAGSDDQVWRSVRPAERIAVLKQAAGVQAAVDRFGDVPFVIDQLEKWNGSENHSLAGKLDLEHLGMSGHSFGAITTQAMMGQKFANDRMVGDPRIDAFFAMSPSPSKRILPERSFGHIAAPVLLMTGTKDASVITPDMTPEKRTLVYTALPSSDKYLLVFEGAEHGAFGDGRMGKRSRIPHHHPAIQTISTRFWDAYLRDEEEAKAWLNSSEVRKGAGLVEKDRWEWK